MTEFGTWTFRGRKTSGRHPGDERGVRAKPGDVDKRAPWPSCCVLSTWERADKMLDLIGTQDPQAALGLSLFRQQIRAEMARREFFADGRVPEFLGDPPDHLKLHLEALIALKDGDVATAAKLLADAESGIRRSPEPATAPPSTTSATSTT